ncbi:MAG: hypothetical protein LBH17_08230 [Oscillospiraceae bacterium]|jgi:hypothetical protein|nr:hypothetical protein [Oscillospiraceae bacterium]
MAAAAIDKSAVAKYLAEFPGELICARQIWYEGLGGHGTADIETVASIEAAIGGVPGWENVGEVRYEKFGAQNSWKRTK